MAEQRNHRASEGPEGRSERPATGMGSPERRGAPQVENLRPLATGMGSTERRGTPQVENLRPLATGMGSPERRGPAG
jgi:hypothetical protein